MENQNQPNNSGTNQNGGGNGTGGNSPRRQSLLLLLVALVITLLIMNSITRLLSSSRQTQKSYNEFIKMVENGEIQSVEIQDSRITATPKNSPYLKYYTGMAEDYTTLTARLLKYDVEIIPYVPDISSTIFNIVLTYLLPVLLMWGLFTLLFRRMNRSGGPFSIGKSNAKVYVQRETGVTFKDVAGEDEAKESLVEVVDFLHNPGKYSGIGARLPKGALLVGPPGTGKTLLAKAVAGEAHVPFYSLAGSDFIELYVGVGASRVRELFKEASKNAPCIIFIDEIDAIGRSRDSKYGGGNEEREQTLNQLLSEMDGFDSSKGVLILGATNRPEILDKALLRPGRFDRRIIVDKPDLKGREAILKVHAKDVRMDESVDLKGIALATSGAVGSDLANMINEAAINAVKAGRELVNQKDLMEAVEQVLVGKEKKDRILSKEERKIVAYHEVGHALISAAQKNTEPVQKITIIPRTMGALGYVMQVPEEEKYLMTKDELHDEIVVTLGGRAAEDLIFNTVTTGAQNDIEKATATARDMITLYGMSDRFGLMQLEAVRSRYLDGVREMICSEATAAEVDEEVRKYLEACYEEAKDIINKHINSMDELAQHLIEHETITGKEFMQIFRRIEGIPEPEEKDEEGKERPAHGRISVRRKESEMVGENVPLRNDHAEYVPDTSSWKEAQKKEEEQSPKDKEAPVENASADTESKLSQPENKFSGEEDAASSVQKAVRKPKANEQLLQAKQSSQETCVFEAEVNDCEVNVTIKDGGKTEAEAKKEEASQSSNNDKPLSAMDRLKALSNDSEGRFSRSSGLFDDNDDSGKEEK